MAGDIDTAKLRALAEAAVPARIAELEGAAEGFASDADGLLRRATAAEAERNNVMDDLNQTRAQYENLEASEVLNGYKNRAGAAEEREATALDQAQSWRARATAAEEENEMLWEARCIERASAEAAAVRVAGQIDYSIDLQRIIEDLCHGRSIRTPKTTARHHYDMAVAARTAAEAQVAERDAEIAKLREALTPFSRAAGWYFSRNFNAGDTVASFITAGMLFDVRAALSATSTPAIDLAAENERLREAITASQAVLARYIVPDSGISERAVVNDLLGILDHRDLVDLMRRAALSAPPQPVEDETPSLQGAAWAALDYLTLAYNERWVEGQESGTIIADLRTALMNNAAPPQQAGSETGERSFPVLRDVWHRKRGAHERVVFEEGELQSAGPISEGARLVTYVGDDGKVWHRPVDEFNDGRFAGEPPQQDRLRYDIVIRRAAQSGTEGKGERG